MTDYYSILGVPRDATDEEIKQARNNLAKEYHPDIAGESSTKRMGEITQAYMGLGSGGKNPEKRKDYDRSLPHTYEGAKKGKAHENTYRKTVLDEIKISETDLGLLSALYQAYKTEDEGFWNVSKSPRDERGWMPEMIYAVKREKGKDPTIYRTVKDWIDPLWGNRESGVVVGGKTRDINSRIREDVLVTPFSAENCQIPYHLKEYFRVLKDMARTFADGGNRFDVNSEMVKTVNWFTKNNHIIQTEGEVSGLGPSKFAPNVEPGKIVRPTELFDEIMMASGRVKTREEGNSKHQEGASFRSQEDGQSGFGGGEKMG